MTWPRTMQQIPINVGDATYDPLYPFGHGMTYP
jgi:beta-glucosidase